MLLEFEISETSTLYFTENHQLWLQLVYTEKTWNMFYILSCETYVLRKFKCNTQLNKKSFVEM